MMTEKRIVFKLFGGLVSLFLMSALLIVSTVILFRPRSFAWFGSNDKVTGEGMQVNLDTLDITMTYYSKTSSDAEYEKINSFANIFDGLVPGDTVWIKVVYANGENKDHSGTVYLSGFDGCENPLVIEGRYYYLSSQLKVVKTGEFLMPPPTDFVSYDSQQSVSQVQVGTVDIAANSSAELEFSVQFVNYTDVDQNAYKNFGSVGTEHCYRIILSDFR